MTANTINRSSLRTQNCLLPCLLVSRLLFILLFASEKNNHVTGEVDSSAETGVEEPRQQNLQEGGQQVLSMAYVTRHNCMGGRVLTGVAKTSNKWGGSSMDRL